VHSADDFVRVDRNKAREKVVAMDEVKVLDSVVDVGVDGKA
jgi:hypothetical protein